jgi:hypothetical protein
MIGRPGAQRAGQRRDGGIAERRAAPRRNAAISSPDLTSRSAAQAAFRSTTSGTCPASSRY